MSFQKDVGVWRSLWRDALKPHGTVSVLAVYPSALLTLVNTHRRMDQIARNDSMCQFFVAHHRLAGLRFAGVVFYDFIHRLRM
jgi:hypothetical protein